MKKDKITSIFLLSNLLAFQYTTSPSVAQEPPYPVQKDPYIRAKKKLLSPETDSNLNQSKVKMEEVENREKIISEQEAPINGMKALEKAEREEQLAIELANEEKDRNNPIFQIMASIKGKTLPDFLGSADERSTAKQDLNKFLMDAEMARRELGQSSRLLTRSY